jgi:hypothetical protein
MSDAHTSAMRHPFQLVRIAKSDDDASFRRDCASRAKKGRARGEPPKRGRSGGGNPDRPWSCWEVVL